MRRRIRRGVQALELDAKVAYQVGLIEVGVMTLINYRGRGTHVNLLFDHQDVQEALEQIHCYPGSEFTSMDIVKIVRGLNKRGRMRFRLQVPYPPPSLAKAWQRAHDRIDLWLKYDLAPEPKVVEPPPEVPEAPTVKEAWDEYWANGKSETLRVKTGQSQTGYWRNHIAPTFATMRTNQIMPKHLEAWLAELRKKGLKESYIRNIYGVFKKMFARLIGMDEDDKLYQKTPYRTINCVSPFDKLLRENKQPKEPPPKERPTYSQERLDLILQACQKHDPTLLPVLSIAIMGGMRISEVLGLHWRDIQWSEPGKVGVIRISGALIPGEGYVERTKTSNGKRDVPMGSFLEKILRWHWEMGLTVETFNREVAKLCPRKVRRNGPPRHLRIKPRPIVRGVRADDFIFLNGVTGDPIPQNSAGGRLKALYKKAGVEREKGELWHEYRHAFVSWAMAKGVDVKTLQLAVGHGDMRTTMRYTHLVEKDHSWINGLYNLGSTPAQLEAKSEQKALDVETPESGRNGGSMGATPKTVERYDPLLESIIAFRKKIKSAQGSAATATKTPVPEPAIAFLWHIYGVCEQPILHPVSRGES